MHCTGNQVKTGIEQGHTTPQPHYSMCSGAYVQSASESQQRGYLQSPKRLGKLQLRSRLILMHQHFKGMLLGLHCLLICVPDSQSNRAICKLYCDLVDSKG